MKFLFDNCMLDDNDYPVKLGIHWYRHKSQENKKLGFKKWKGFTVVFYLIWWQLHFTWVNDYKAYKYRMDFRYLDWKDRQ